jgi:tetratricopeptide (TPR) repeat protein
MLEQLKRGGFDDTKPVVLEITRRLAQAYYDQGKQRQAEILYRKLISAQKRSDATELADMLSVQIDLVNTICEQGRFLEAKDLQANVHGAIINAFASHHHLVRRSLSAIIRIWGLLQNHEEEEAICRQLVQISLTHLGPRDPDTLDAIYRLALAMRGRKQFVESESLQRITVQLYQEAHKYRHSDICWSLEALARVFNDQGRTEEAINLFRLSAERAREFLGVEHVSTMNCYRVLGRELRKQGLFQESEELLVATVKIQINVMGEDYPYTLWSIYELGETLLKRDKYQESSIWLKKSFRQSLVIFGPLNDLAIESCDSLGVCYESQGLYGEAMALYQELLDKLRAAKGDNEQSIAKVEGWIQDIHSFGAEWAERYP